MSTFAAPVDAGAAWSSAAAEPLDKDESRSAWASARACCPRPGCCRRPEQAQARRSSPSSRPLSHELAATAHDTLYVEGSRPACLREHPLPGSLAQIDELVQMLEARRAARPAAHRPGPPWRILVRPRRRPTAPAPAVPRASIAANYGLPQARAGRISLVGPVRMDYGRAIGTVPEAARQLSLVADVFERGAGAAAHAARVPPRSSASRATRDEAPGRRRRSASSARELHPDVDARDPQAEEKFEEAAEAYEILSDAERRQVYDRYGREGLRNGGPAPNVSAFRLRRRSTTRRTSAAAGAAAPPRAATSRWPSTSASPDAARGAAIDVAYQAVNRCERCRGNGAEPRHADRRVRALRRQRRPARRQARTPFGQVIRTQWTASVCGGDGKRPTEPCRRCGGRRPPRSPSATLRVRRPRPASPTAGASA